MIEIAPVDGALQGIRVETSGESAVTDRDKEPTRQPELTTTDRRCPTTLEDFERMEDSETQRRDCSPVPPPRRPPVAIRFDDTSRQMSVTEIEPVAISFTRITELTMAVSNVAAPDKEPK